MYEHDIVYLQDNLLRMKPTKWISERFHLTSSPRSACISPTRSVTPTAPQKYPNSPSRRRSHWNYSWLLTFWIAKVAKIMERKLKTFLVVFFFFFFWVFNLFCYSLHMKNNPFSVVCCCFISIKRWHFNMLNGYSRMWQMCPPPRNLSSPHHLNKDVFGEHFVSSLWYLVPHEMKYHLHNEYASYFYSFLKFKKKDIWDKGNSGDVVYTKTDNSVFCFAFSHQ